MRAPCKKCDMEIFYDALRVPVKIIYFLRAVGLVTKTLRPGITLIYFFAGENEWDIFQVYISDLTRKTRCGYVYYHVK